jgi:hypothetical protein
LGRERRDGEDAVEEGLAAHLDEADYDFGFGIRFEVGEEGVGAGFPFFVVVKAELFWGEGMVRWLDKGGFWGRGEYSDENMHTKKWLPKLLLRCCHRSLSSDMHRKDRCNGR